MKKILLLLLLPVSVFAQTWPNNARQSGGIAFTPQWNYKGTTINNQTVQGYNLSNNLYFGIYSAYQIDSLFLKKASATGLYIQNGISPINQNFNLGIGVGVASAYNKLKITAGDSSRRNIILSNLYASGVVPTTASDIINIGSGGLAKDTSSNININIGTNGLHSYTGVNPGDGPHGGGQMINIGWSGLYAATTAETDENVGSWGLRSITTGQSNSNFGYNGSFNITTGNYNSSYGNEGLQQASGNSSFNTSVGYQAMYGNMDFPTRYYAFGNTAVGFCALGNIAGTDSIFQTKANTVIGFGAGSNITTGSENIIIGAGVGAENITGNDQLNIGNIFGATGIYSNAITVQGHNGERAVTDSTHVTDGRVFAYSIFSAPSLYQTSWSAGTAGTDSVVVRKNGGYKSVPANSLFATGYLPLTAGSGHPLTASLFSSAGNNTNVFVANTATTGYQEMVMANTSGYSLFAQEGSVAGTTATGSCTYCTVIGSGVNKSLQLATNDIVRITIDGSGNIFLGGTVSSNGNTITGKTESPGTNGTAMASTAYVDRLATIHGNSTTTGTATTAVTVTIGSTMANTAYNTTITPRDLLTAVNYYISAQTTTTFTVTFISALTGSINFDYSVIP